MKHVIFFNLILVLFVSTFVPQLLLASEKSLFVWTGSIHDGKNYREFTLKENEDFNCQIPDDSKISCKFSKWSNGLRRIICTNKDSSSEFSSELDCNINEPGKSINLSVNNYRITLNCKYIEPDKYMYYKALNNKCDPNRHLNHVK